MTKTKKAADKGLSSASPHLQAALISEALPFMQHYDKQTVVVKYGGHAMGDPRLA